MKPGSDLSDRFFVEREPFVWSKLGTIDDLMTVDDDETY